MEPKPNNIIVNVTQANPSIFSSWKFTAILIVIISLVGFVMYRIAQKRSEIQRFKKNTRTNCTKSSRKITLIIHCRETNGIEITKRIFRTAFCPFRVNVVLYISNQVKGTVRDQLKRTSDEMLQPFVDQVNFVQTAGHSTMSHIETLCIVFQKTNPSSSFTCLMHELSFPQQHWDKTIIGVYQTLPQSTAISYVPPEKIQSVVAKNSYMTSTVFNNLKDYMKNSSYMKSGSDEEVGKITQFPVLHWNRGPIVVGRLLPRVYTRPLKSTVVSSMFLFMYTKQLKDVLEEIPSEILKLCRRRPSLPCTDYILSGALRHADITPYAICKSVTYVKSQAYKNSGKNSLRIFQSDEVQNYLNDFGDFAGVDLMTSTCSGRARMGLFPDYSKTEILSKYRSMKEFERIKELICGVE